jgi:uncharacterized membrane protein YgcG
MALSSEVQTRIDQLAADLRRNHAAQAAVVIHPSNKPLFTTHHDGSVTDQAGTILRGPVPK